MTVAEESLFYLATSANSSGRMSLSPSVFFASTLSLSALHQLFLFKYFLLDYTVKLWNPLKLGPVSFVLVMQKFTSLC